MREGGSEEAVVDGNGRVVGGGRLMVASELTGPDRVGSEAIGPPFTTSGQSRAIANIPSIVAGGDQQQES